MGTQRREGSIPGNFLEWGSDSVDAWGLAHVPDQDGWNREQHDQDPKGDHEGVVAHGAVEGWKDLAAATQTGELPVHRKREVLRGKGVAHAGAGLEFRHGA